MTTATAIACPNQTVRNGFANKLLKGIPKSLIPYLETCYDCNKNMFPGYFLNQAAVLRAYFETGVLSRSQKGHLVHCEIYKHNKDILDVIRS